MGEGAGISFPRLNLGDWRQIWSNNSVHHEAQPNLGEVRGFRRRAVAALTMLGDSLSANVRVRVESGLHQRQGWSASSDARADENGACRIDDLFNLVVSPAFLVIAWAHVGAIGHADSWGWTV